MALFHDGSDQSERSGHLFPLFSSHFCEDWKRQVCTRSKQRTKVSAVEKLPIISRAKRPEKGRRVPRISRKNMRRETRPLDIFVVTLLCVYLRKNCDVAAWEDESFAKKNSRGVMAFRNRSVCGTASFSSRPSQIFCVQKKRAQTFFSWICRPQKKPGDPGADGASSPFI